MKKSPSKIKWFTLILSLLLMFPLTHNTLVFAAEPQEVPKTTIRVGYTINDQLITKHNNEFTGYGVTYLNMLARYTNWEYEYVFVEDEKRMEELQNGNIDLLCGVSADEIRNQEILLSDKDCCMHYALLCAKKDDTSIFYNDYELVNGKRIAVNTSRSMESMLEEFAREYHLTYTPVYCTSFSEMESAIDEGRADLLVTANLRNLENYKYVAKMGMRDLFFAVSANHPELMQQINSADHQVKLKQPFILASLYETYYGRPSEKLIGTTREEHDFIQSKTPIRVVCDAGNFPISYMDEDTGEYSGIYADALKLIEQESGLIFEFIPLDKYKNSWEMLQNGEADMSANMYLDDELKQKFGLISSNPYITSNFTMILHRQRTLEDTSKIALPENYKGLQKFVVTRYPKWEIVEAENVAECLRMAESGIVDGTLMNSVFLQTTYNLSNYPNLIPVPPRSIDLPMSCAFSGSRAELLCGIVNKAISQIPKKSFENCILDNSVKISYEPTMLDMLRKAFPVLLLIFFIFVLTYLLALWVREKHYHHLATTDSLTGLWNGMYFREKAQELLSRNPQKEYQLISMDIEHFRYIGTDFGDKTADTILQAIAQRLRNLFGGNALYAREMGDTFLICIESSDSIADVLHELTHEISLGMNGMEQSYKPEIKFGICNIMADALVPISEYIDRSLTAKKSIKQNPLKRIACYDNKMAERDFIESQIEKNMENALKNREFVVYYQPKYHLRSGTIIGAEALVRWKEPKQGMISPDTFIPVFERNGFIIQLDFYVYGEVLKTIARWLKEGRKEIVISVNVSRAHIGSSDFLSKLVALADYYDVPHKMLELELTETILGGKRKDMLAFINSCKAEGFLISIDDFGSGYSSLNLLKELPVDILKIDREFLNETEVSEKSRIIIEHIVEMATKLQIHTLCEGVETQSQAEFLNKIGCNLAQGYLYSKPIPLEDFEARLNSEA